MASEQELRDWAKKAPSKRSDSEQAALSADQLPLSVRNEMSATDRRIRIHGR